MMPFPTHPPASRAPRLRLAGVAFAVLLLTGTVSGCATKGDLRDVQTDIRELAEQQEALLTEIDRQNRMTLDTLRTQSSQLTDVRGNVSQQLRQVVDQLERLTELTGQNQRALQALRDQLVALERRGAYGGGMAGGGGTMGGDAGGDGEAMGDVPAPEVAYTEANSHFNRGSLTAARIGFQQFLQAYPNHDLAPLAHAKLADILVQEERFEEAIEAFERIPELYPGHQQVPDAIYRIGVMHMELGEMQAARRAFERVINSYPDSGMADLARDRLEEIGGER